MRFMRTKHIYIPECKAEYIPHRWSWINSEDRTKGEKCRICGLVIEVKLRKIDEVN